MKDILNYKDFAKEMLQDELNKALYKFMFSDDQINDIGKIFIKEEDQINEVVEDYSNISKYSKLYFDINDINTINLLLYLQNSNKTSELSDVINDVILTDDLIYIIEKYSTILNKSEVSIKFTTMKNYNSYLVELIYHDIDKYKLLNFKKLSNISGNNLSFKFKLIPIIISDINDCFVSKYHAELFRYKNSTMIDDYIQFFVNHLNQKVANMLKEKNEKIQGFYINNYIDIHEFSTINTIFKLSSLELDYLIYRLYKNNIFSKKKSNISPLNDSQKITLDLIDNVIYVYLYKCEIGKNNCMINIRKDLLYKFDLN